MTRVVARCSFTSLRAGDHSMARGSIGMKSYLGPGRTRRGSNGSVGTWGGAVANAVALPVEETDRAVESAAANGIGAPEWSRSGSCLEGGAVRGLPNRELGLATSCTELAALDEAGGVAALDGRAMEGRFNTTATAGALLGELRSCPPQRLFDADDTAQRCASCRLGQRTCNEQPVTSPRGAPLCSFRPLASAWCKTETPIDWTPHRCGGSAIAPTTALRRISYG